MESFKAQSEDQYSSIPYELALDERYIEIFKQYINLSLYKNPDLLTLIDKLILATDKDDKETIRSSIKHYLTNPQADYNYQNYLNWLAENSQNLGMPPTKREYIQTIVRLNIRDKVADTSLSKANDLMEQLKKRLRECYREKIGIKRLFYPEHPLSLDACYIHLGLTLKPELEATKNLDDKTKVEAGDFDQRDFYLRSFQREVAIEKTLEVAEMAKIYLPEHQRILIEGPAGSGKTTLCRYIAYQWALGKESKEPWAQQYDWLFWIPLRELIALSNNSQADLVTILLQVCFRFNATTNLLRKKDNEELFLEHLTTDPQRVLYLLDGYDEVDLLHPIIQTLWGELQSNEQIILTTRPGRPITFNPPFKLQLAVLGLSSEQIKNYTTSFFSQAPIQSPDMAKVCYEFIQANINLWSLAHSPINLEMLCSLWDQKALNNQTNINLTDLYQLIFQNLLVRYVKRLQLNVICTPGSAKQYCHAHIAFMEYLAFLAMQQGVVFIQNSSLIDTALKQVNKTETIDKSFLDELQALGLLNFYQEGQQAEFAHLTFQEFFAARYIKKQLLEFVQSTTLNLEAFKQLLQFIQTKKHEPFYEVMWWFVAGLLAQKPEKPFLVDINPKQDILENVSRNHLKLQALQLFVDCVLQLPRHSKDELNDVCLLMKCLDEAKLPNIMQKQAIISLFLKYIKIILDIYFDKHIELIFLPNTLSYDMWKIQNYFKSCSLLLYKDSTIKNYFLKFLEDKKLAQLEILNQVKFWSYIPNIKKNIEIFLKDDNKKIQHITKDILSQLDSTSTSEFEQDVTSVFDTSSSSSNSKKDEEIKYQSSQAINKHLAALCDDLSNNSKNVQFKVLKEIVEILQNWAAEKNASYDNNEIILEKNISCIKDEIQNSIVNKILEILNNIDGDAEVKKEAIKIFLLLKPDSSELNIKLEEYLSDKNEEMCIKTIESLRELYSEIDLTLQNKLLSLIESSNDYISLSAFVALSELNSDSIKDELNKAILKLIKINNISIQFNILRVISNNLCLYVNSEVQMALLSMLFREERIIYREVLWIFSKLGFKTCLEVKEELIKLLKNENKINSSRIKLFLMIICNSLEIISNSKQNSTLLPPSQLFNWTEQSITQLVLLCGEMQKPILQNGDVLHVLTKDYWTLALVRKKDHQHVFLVLEGVQDANHFAKKIELVLPYSSGSSFMNPNYAEIRVEDIIESKDYIRLKNLSENCECQIYSITAEIGNQMIGNAKADQEAKIYYNYSDDGRAYSFSFFNNERDNCLSWCLKQLQAVGIPLKRHWLDVVCVLPENYMLSTENQENTSASRCVIS